jgi:PAS domain S-box-containing protein
VLDHRAPLAAPALLEALPDTVVVADHDGRIAYVSWAVTDLLGQLPEDLVGEPLQVLMPERLRQGHGTGFARHAATGRGKLVGVTTRLPALHAAGHEAAIHPTSSRLTDEGGDDGAQCDESGLLQVLRETAVEAVQAAVDRHLTGPRHERDDLAVLALQC